MSHNLIFAKFQKGERAPFELEKLLAILRKHSCEIRPFRDKHGTQIFTILPPLDGDSCAIFGDEGLIELDGDHAIEFGIGRPLYDRALAKLAMELLDSLDLVMFPDFGEVALAKRGQTADLPPDLAESCERGLRLVQSEEEIWQVWSEEEEDGDYEEEDKD